MTKEYAFTCCQCRHSSGKVGSFVRSPEGVELSPLFDSLQYVYDWMRPLGWVMDENERGGAFHPFRISRFVKEKVNNG